MSIAIEEIAARHAEARTKFSLIAEVGDPGRRA
jgi:hypothetical protein